MLFNIFLEFDPEFCPKWKYLLEILRVEIPAHINEHQSDSKSSSQKILILCNNQRTCAQIQNFLKLGPEKYLFENALKEEIDLSKISKKFSNFEVKSVDCKMASSSQISTEETSCFKKPSKANEANETHTIESSKVSRGNALLKSLCTGIFWWGWLQFLTYIKTIKLLIKFSDKAKTSEAETEIAPQEDDLNKVLENEEEDLNKSCYLLTFTQEFCRSKNDDKMESSSARLFEDFDEVFDRVIFNVLINKFAFITDLLIL